jgi:hypothetical protein
MCLLFNSYVNADYFKCIMHVFCLIALNFLRTSHAKLVEYMICFIRAFVYYLQEHFCDDCM